MRSELGESLVRILREASWVGTWHNVARSVEALLITQARIRIRYSINNRVTHPVRGQIREHINRRIHHEQ